MTSPPRQPKPAGQPADFDERLWPVDLALLVLAGFIAGVIVAKSDFQTPLVVYNGYLHLGALAAIVGALLWGVARFGARVQRRLQLGVFVSLLVHFWLCMLSYNVYLSMALREEPDAAEQFEEPQIVTLPDYHWQDQQDVMVDEAIEAPVETELPEAESHTVEQTRPEPTPIERPSEAEPAAPRREPNPVELERAEMTPPHRSEQLAGERISRSETQSRLPAEQVETPTIAESPQQASTMQDRVEAVERQATTAHAERRTTQPAAVAPAPEQARLQRRAAVERPTAAANVSQPARRMASAPTESPQRVEQPAPPAPQRASEPSLSPRSSGVARQAQRADASRPATSAPAGEARPDVAAARRQESSSRPQLDRIAAAARARTTSEATAAAGAQAPMPAPAASSSTLPDDSPTQPAATGLTKASGGATGLTRQRNFDRALPGAGQLARTPTAASTGEPRRAETQARESTAAGAAGPTGAALVRTPTAAAASGDVEPVELPSTMPADGARSSVAATNGSNSAARDNPQAPAIDGAARQVASLPNSSLSAAALPSAAGLPGESANPTAAGGMRLAAPSAGGPAAPRRSDPLEDAAASLAGASGSLMPRGASPAAAGNATIDLAEIASPSDGPADSAPGPSPNPAAAARSDLPVGRMASAGLPVRIAAPSGPGGLRSQPAVDVGVPSRRARPESAVVHTAAGRIILERSGGKQAADVRVRDTAVPGLRQRDRATRRELARQRGGSESSERAVEMGLDFLARHQNPDGSWSLHDFSQGQPGYENAGFGRMRSDTAATGLSMLAFLGAGYTHTDGKYRLVVGRGLGYLVGNQRADGDLFLPQDAQSNLNVWLYSHGIAAIALGEAYGMTRDPALRGPAQRALDFIVAAQSPTEGGWRYSPRQGSDTSVSGWQLMALKSGELAGLDAPAETYRRVEAWLDGAQARENPALYAYRPKARQDHQRLPSRVMTAEGLLMRQYLGWKRDNPYMLAGADYLLGQLPQWEGARQRDAYYWYYATQVMFQMGGEHWQAWNDSLREMLIERQTPAGPLAGSWDPLGRWPDRWGREAGRLYTTAMHLLMLEVYYRHLPLYRNLEGEGAAE
ncbi:MAG TPA: hypothetical protein VMV10_11005 [Pirellulales bacterium]|nr:hypothetical protein [Pirellulales bacterium]